MKPLISFLAALLLTVGGCNDSPAAPASLAAAAATQSASTRPADESRLAGRWTGNAAIIVQWTQQKQLPVTLDITADGIVTGRVGDAGLVNGRFVSRWPNTGYRVHGRLEGNLIDAEQVRRDAVDILFERTDDGTLTGGLHSSGSKFGGRSSMKLSATSLVLRRQP